MFGKLFASVAAAGVVAAVLTTGAMAAPATAAGTARAKPATQARHQAKDMVGGTVTAVSETQLTVKSAKGEAKTFLRTDKTIVVKGRNEKAAWSEIEVSSHVRVRYESRDGKLYAKRVHLGRAHLAGKVESVAGNGITIRTRDGKDVRLTVTSDTKYFEVLGKRKAGALADIHAGMRLAAAGTYDASHNFDAATIAYRNK